MITMKELQDKIGGVFYFATVENGEPRVRPFGFTMVFEDKLYFGCGTHKAAYAPLMKDPHLEVCAFKDGRIAKFGTVEEVITKENLSEIYRVDFEILNIQGKPLSIYY